MFTPLGLNRTHNIHAATNHLPNISQKKTSYYGAYNLTSTTSSAWNELQGNINENIIECKISEFKKIILQTYLPRHFNSNQAASALPGQDPIFDQLC